MTKFPGGRQMRYAIRHLVEAELERPVMSGDLRKRLHDIFDPDIERLSALTGKSFPEWLPGS